MTLVLYDLFDDVSCRDWLSDLSAAAWQSMTSIFFWILFECIDDIRLILDVDRFFEMITFLII